MKVLSLLAMLLVPGVLHAYTTFSQGALKSCSIAHLNKPSFKICLGGSASRLDFERAKEWATLSSLAWLRVFKAFDNTMQTNIEFSCESPALTIILKNGQGRSYATSGKTWIYNESPYGTWTHELGHAFVGLGDTYSGGSAGRCRSGQPPSLMCWGGYGPRGDRNEFSTLWQDDIDGALYNYRRLFGATLPSAAEKDFSLIKAFDPKSPYPNAEAAIFSFSDASVVIDENGKLTPINPDAEFE